jgi:hypothetical protein
MTAHDHREPHRVKRPPARRIGPQRNSYGAFRSASGAAQPKAPEGPTSAIDEAIETAYRVCDDYLRRGRSAAQARASTGYESTMYNQQNPWGDSNAMQQMWTNAFNAWMAAWMGMMPGAWPGMSSQGAGNPFAPTPKSGHKRTAANRRRDEKPEPAHDGGFGGAFSSHEDQWEDDDWDDENDCDYDEPNSHVSANERPSAKVIVEVAAGRASKVALSLDPGLSTDRLLLGRIATLHGHELPIAAESFAAADGRITINLVIPPEQASGNYSGLIFDSATEHACGRIDVQVMDHPRV